MNLNDQNAMLISFLANESKRGYDSMQNSGVRNDSLNRYVNGVVQAVKYGLIDRSRADAISVLIPSSKCFDNPQSYVSLDSSKKELESYINSLNQKEASMGRTR